MSGELLTNPAVVGVACGLVGLMTRSVLSRIFGGANEKSIPTQFAEILARLAAIDTKLEVAATKRAYMEKQLNELETDFWDHMKEYHREFVSRRRPHTKPDDSGAHAVKE